jgi:hypothetical protein
MDAAKKRPLRGQVLRPPHPQSPAQFALPLEVRPVGRSRLQAWRVGFQHLNEGPEHGGDRTVIEPHTSPGLGPSVIVVWNFAVSPLLAVVGTQGCHQSNQSGARPVIWAPRPWKCWPPLRSRPPDGADEVSDPPQVVESTAPPLYIYSENAERTGDVGA